MRQHRLAQDADQKDLEREVASALLVAGVEAPAGEVLRNWIGEDQADFDRAVLVSELIARPAATATPATTPPTTPPPPASTSPGEKRPRLAQPRSITDLLDDMLAQPGAR